MSSKKSNNMESWDDELLWTNIVRDLDKHKRKKYIIILLIVLIAIAGISYSLLELLKLNDSSYDPVIVYSSNSPEYPVVDSTLAITDNVTLIEKKDGLDSNQNSQLKRNISTSKRNNESHFDEVSNASKSNKLTSNELYSTSHDFNKYNKKSSNESRTNNSNSNFENIINSNDEIIFLRSKLNITSLNNRNLNYIPYTTVPFTKEKLVSSTADLQFKNKPKSYITHLFSLGNYKMANKFDNNNDWSKRKNFNERPLYSLGYTLKFSQSLSKTIILTTGIRYSRYISILEDKTSSTLYSTVPSDSAIIVSAVTPLHIAGNVELETTTDQFYKVYNYNNQLAIPLELGLIIPFDNQSVILSIGSSIQVYSGLKGFSLSPNNNIESISILDIKKSHFQPFKTLNLSSHYTRNLFSNIDLIIGLSYERSFRETYSIQGPNSSLFRSRIKDLYNFDIGFSQKF